MLYLFQVYSSDSTILHHAYQFKCSYHLSPYKLITILLTIFPLLYFSSLWLIYFITGSLFYNLFMTLNPFHLLHPSLCAPSHKPDREQKWRSTALTWIELVRGTFVSPARLWDLTGYTLCPNHLWVAFLPSLFYLLNVYGVPTVCQILKTLCWWTQRYYATLNKSDKENYHMVSPVCGI